MRQFLYETSPQTKSESGGWNRSPGDSFKGLLLFRLKLELSFGQAATPRPLRICRAGGVILCHTIFRRVFQVLTRWIMCLVSEAAFGVHRTGMSEVVISCPIHALELQGSWRKPTEKTTQAWSSGAMPINSKTLLKFLIMWPESGKCLSLLKSEKTHPLSKIC